MVTSPMTEPVSPVEELEARLDANWGHLRESRQLSCSKAEEVRRAITGLDTEDTSIVVSGSLAREEFTAGSDIDWTLLIDGMADPRHHDVYRKAASEFATLANKKVGDEGTFGSMVFSHDLIHEIGGEDDTNKNLTRRMLQLLETRVMGREDAYRRVVRSILKRYLLEDRGLWKGSGHRVPRFLQNDFARYWRTMAVDFAYKLRKRSGREWALRNIKLRMSRKLIYASGLLACYRCHLDFSSEERRAIFDDPERHVEIVEHLESIFRETPLDIVAGILLRYVHLNGSALRIFDSYNEFIGILADASSRKHLNAMTEDRAEKDEIYQRARQISHEFRDGLQALFFDGKSGLEALTKTYGVF
jgi:predicted nucleotidyltransferase